MMTWIFCAVAVVAGLFAAWAIYVWGYERGRLDELYERKAESWWKLLTKR